MWKYIVAFVILRFEEGITISNGAIIGDASLSERRYEVSNEYQSSDSAWVDYNALNNNTFYNESYHNSYIIDSSIDSIKINP